MDFTDMDLRGVEYRIAKRQRFKHIWLPGWLVDPGRKCGHSYNRRIYGEEIIQANYRRNRCYICGRLY